MKQNFTLFRYVETGTNKLGEPKFELKPMYNFTGYIDLMGGSDQQTLNSANIPESSHLLFTKDTNIDATNKDKVKHIETDTLYEITFVDNPMQRSHHLEIFLRTVV